VIEPDSPFLILNLNKLAIEGDAPDVEDQSLPDLKSEQGVGAGDKPWRPRAALWLESNCFTQRQPPEDTASTVP
jgi:hypothetical protein